MAVTADGAATDGATMDGEMNMAHTANQSHKLPTVDNAQKAVVNPL